MLNIQYSTENRLLQNPFYPVCMVNQLFQVLIILVFHAAFDLSLAA